MARHAEASKVKVDLDGSGDDGVALTVRDDGRGFDARRRQRSGLGLAAWPSARASWAAS